MPKRVESSSPKPTLRVPSPTNINIATPSPVPLPRSGSRQSSLGSPSVEDRPPSPRLQRSSKIEADDRAQNHSEEVFSSPPTKFADTPTEQSPAKVGTELHEPVTPSKKKNKPHGQEEVDGAVEVPPPLPTASPPPLSPQQPEPVDEPAPAEAKPKGPPPKPLPYSKANKQNNASPAMTRHEAEPETKPAVPEVVEPTPPESAAEQPAAERPDHVDANGDLYAIPERPNPAAVDKSLRDEVPPRRSVTEQEVAMEPRSTRPGKTYAGYTGLFGDIKTILIEKNGMKLGIAVTGGANTKQREVRIKDIVVRSSFFLISPRSTLHFPCIWLTRSVLCTRQARNSKTAPWVSAKLCEMY